MLKKRGVGTLAQTFESSGRQDASLSTTLTITTFLATGKMIYDKVSSDG